MTFPSTSFAGAVQASLLFFEPNKQVPSTTGPLHLLFCLLRVVLPHMCVWLTPHSLHISVQMSSLGWNLTILYKVPFKQIYYEGWNRPPAQVGCMRQVLRAGALGWPRGMGWGGRQEGGWGWGTHVNPLLIHQYCKVISLQLIKINEKEKETWTKCQNKEIINKSSLDIKKKSTI